MDTPNTPQDIIKSKLFTGLKQVMPRLKPQDITLKEAPHEMNQRITAVAQEVLGITDAITNRSTTISVKGMSADQVKGLREILHQLTDTWVSYGATECTFFGSMDALSKLLDANQFNHFVKVEMPPSQER